MCSDTVTPSAQERWAIDAQGLGKCYGLYERPLDRLKQLLFGRWRTYGREFWSVRDVNLQIGQGEVVGLIGRNGAGKSTLLQMICGTLAPSAGSLRVDGRVAALLELGAGFNPEFTGIENVYISGALMGLSRSQVQQRLPQILAFADIGEFAHQRVKTYSSGMFMRLAFAVATSVEPDLLVIDEALSVGDGSFARKSFDRIMQMKAAGKTILFCSHSMYQIEALCSRAIWLDQGQVRMQGPASEVAYAYNASLEAADTQPLGLLAQASATRPSGGTGHLIRASLHADGQSGSSVQLRSGLSDLTIRVEFMIDPSLPAPGVALGFANGQGQTIASITSVHDAASLQVDHIGHGLAEVTLPAIPLLKGDYTITVFLCSEDALHPYDQAEHCLRFKVVQEHPEQGLVSLPRRWHSAAQETQ
jgi:lipopolysaccharide transport system ATP-binding protein